MGTDIHLFIEVKQNGQWQHFDWRKEFEIENTHGDWKSYDWERMMESPFGIDRNYDLFAILADVRNRRGFAGAPTGAGFKPIDEPRGLPDDITPEVASEAEGWGVDGHSHSWLLLKEVQGYDYEQTTVHYGLLGLGQYEKFKKTGLPDSYCGDAWGQSIRKVTNEDADKLLSGEMAKEDGIEYMTYVAWPETYRQCVGEHWFKFMDACQELGDEVRLVFWFDN